MIPPLSDTGFKSAARQRVNQQARTQTSLTNVRPKKEGEDGDSPTQCLNTLAFFGAHINGCPFASVSAGDRLTLGGQPAVERVSVFTARTMINAHTRTEAGR